MARGLLALVAAVILGATLLPVSGADPTPLSNCLICGGRGVADAILNVLLFFPLGVAITLLGVSWPYAALASFLFSSVIEVMQVLVPGRDPSWGDLLFNSLGGMLGALAVRALLRSFALPNRGRTGLWITALVALAGIFVASGYLAQPVFPVSTYYGQWATYLGSTPWYHFHVLDASIAGRPLPPRRIAQSEEVRAILAAGPRINVLAIALPSVPPARRLIGVYDRKFREIVRLASTQDDLVLTYRMRATTLRLDQPQLRFGGVLRGIGVGDSVRVAVSGEWQRPCVVVNQSGACAAGLTLGSGWRFLLDVAALPTWLRALVNGAWVAILALPIGLWAFTGWRVLISGVIVVSALVLLPAPLNLVPSPPMEIAGALLGAAVGFVFRKAVAGKIGKAVAS